MKKQKAKLVFAFIFAMTIGFISGCGGGGGDSTSSSARSVTSNADDLKSLEKSIALENEAYMQIISEFTGNGDYAPFDERIEFNATTLEKMDELTKSLAKAYEGYDNFYTSINNKYPDILKLNSVAEKKMIKTSNIFARLIKSTTGYDAGRERMRTFMSKVFNGQTAQQKIKAYDVIKSWATQGKRNVDVGSNFSTFYEKLNNGELDEIVYRLHITLYHSDDAGDGAADYVEKSEKFGATPGKLAWTIGTDAINKATEFEIKAYALATGPLGVAIEKGAEYVNTINNFHKDPDLKAAFKNVITKKMSNVIKTKLGKVVQEGSAYAKFHSYVNDKVSTKGAEQLVNSVTNNIQHFTKRAVINKKLKDNNYDAKKVLEELKAEDDAGDVDWNVGGLIQSVSDSVKNTGSMLLSWYNEESKRYNTLYNPNVQTDESIIIVSSEHNYTMTVLDDKNETKVTKLTQKENVQVTENNLTVVSVDLEKPTVTNLAITKSQNTIYVNDEVTLHIIIPHTMYPPFSLTYSGNQHAVFVLSANLSKRDIDFAEFSSSAKGNFSYTITVTDKYNNSMSESITLPVVEKTVVQPPVATTQTYKGSITAETKADGCLEPGTYADVLTVKIDASNNVFATLNLQGHIFHSDGIVLDDTNKLVDDGTDSITWSGSINGNILSGRYHDVDDESGDDCYGSFSVTKQ